MAKDKYEFNPKEEIEKITNWIKRYFYTNATPETHAVVGISGGKDSTITAALLARALGPERVIGVMMPCHYQADLQDAESVCEYLGIQKMTIDIGPATTALYKSLEASKNIVFNNENVQRITSNTPARIRMTTLYAVAAAVGGRVANTCNYSEDYLGYSTKFGDTAGDFSLLSYFTATEVKQLGYALGLPKRFVDKAPTDGMCGKTDEENFGFTYAELDNFLRNEIYPDYDSYRDIMDRHTRNLHKVESMPAYFYIPHYS